MENNFEKEVRQKMEELSLTPSAPVWQGVQGAIRRNRHRRRMLLWLLPLLLLGGGIGYLFFENNGPAPVAIKEPEPRRTQTGVDPLPQQENNSLQRRRLPGEIQHEEPRKPTLTEENNSEIGFENSSVAGVPVAKTGRKAGTANASFKPARQAAGKTGAANKPTAASVTVQQQDIIAPEPAVSAEGNPYIQENTVLPLRVRNIRIEQPQRTPELATPGASFVPDTIALQRPLLQVRHVAVPEWQWGINARVGVSGTSSFSLTEMKAGPSAADFLASPVTSGGTAQRPPAQPQRSLAFSAAIYAKRNFGAGTWLEGGLQYSYYSTNMTVGTKRTDTAVNVNTGFNSTSRLESYYRNDGNVSRHINALHFVELPLIFGYRPLKNIPLQLRHGFSAGRYLAGSNLQYDGRANIYYESDESLRKMQWHLLSSAEYQVVQAKGFRAFAGPEFQYGLTALKKDGNSNQLFFVGLKSRFEF